MSVSFHVDLRASVPRGSESSIKSSSRLELSGTIDESVRDVHSIVFSVRPTDKTDPGPVLPPSVGAIIQIRPYVSFVIGFPTAAFDRIWSLALPGQLRYARLVFTKPHYNKALVVSTSFSTDPEE